MRRPTPKRWKPLLGGVVGIGVLVWLLIWGGAFSSEPVASPPPNPPAPTAEPIDTAAPAPTQPAPPPVPATVPAHGSGQVRVANFVRPAPAGQQGKTVRVRLEVENELPLDPEAVATEAANALQDPRSWTSRGEGHFDFVGTGAADLTIRVLTPDSTDARCLPLKTMGEVSCRNGDGVNLNARRWVDAVPDYRGDIAGYRQYVVNHEVGHYLGHDHSPCPGRDAVAPVMMQQTKGLEGCRANSWPLKGWRP